MAKIAATTRMTSTTPRFRLGAGFATETGLTGVSNGGSVDPVGATGASWGPDPGAGWGTGAGAGVAGLGADQVGVGSVGSLGPVIGSLLLVAKGGDGVEASGLPRGPDAEHDADGEAEQQRDDEGDWAEDEAPAGDLRR